jgi:hypothetical protein
MSEIVNLRSVRKNKARAAKEVIAQANRVEHGVSKSVHKRAKALAEAVKRKVDGHRLDD